MIFDFTAPQFGTFGVQSTNWILAHGPRLLFLILAAYLISKLVSKSTKKLLVKIARHHGHGDSDSNQRAETLLRIFDGTMTAIVWIIITLIAFDNIGINIGPILATAGVVGVAVGFGSQYLIKDLISGFFIIIENHYRVGDLICIGPNCGFVVAMNLRVTTLRDQDGTIYQIPNGEVRISLNQSKLNAKVNFTIGVASEAKLEKVMAIINEIGEALAREDGWKEMITSAPHFARVDTFTDTAMVVRVQGATDPMKQPEVTAELRKRIKLAFDKEGILVRAG